MCMVVIGEIFNIVIIGGLSERPDANGHEWRDKEPSGREARKAAMVRSCECEDAPKPKGKAPLSVRDRGKAAWVKLLCIVEW